MSLFVKCHETTLKNYSNSVSHTAVANCIFNVRLQIANTRTTSQHSSTRSQTPPFRFYIVLYKVNVNKHNWQNAMWVVIRCVVKHHANFISISVNLINNEASTILHNCFVFAAFFFFGLRENFFNAYTKFVGVIVS